MPDSGRRRVVPALVAGLLVGAFGLHHVDQTLAAVGKREFADLLVINLAMFSYLTMSLVMAHSHREIKPSRSSRKLDVVVVMTVFNEDPTTFLEALRSLAKQTMLPAAIWAVDDGSEDPACRNLFRTWSKEECPAGVATHLHFQENAGKRHAQAVAFLEDQDATIFMTMDSDTILDEHAIENGVAPFANKKIMSVAGLILGLNHARKFVAPTDKDGKRLSRVRLFKCRLSHSWGNVLATVSDYGTASSSLSGRAFWSRLGSVPVNSGALSFYRAAVVRENLDHYLTQKVMGRQVQSGDDAMLTHYALLRGRAVFQSSSRGYTLMPVRLKHLTKQRVRWWRSYFWSNAWVLWRFPVTKPIWWMRLWSVLSFVFMSGVLPWVFVVVPVMNKQVAWGIFLVAAILSYVQASMYLTLRRPDQSLSRQLVVFLLAPLNFVVNMYLIWALQYVGLFTVAKTGWSTRQQVEVGLEPIAQTGEPNAEPAPAIADEPTTKFRPVRGEPATVRIRPVPRPQAAPFAPRGSLAAAAQTLRFRPVRRTDGRLEGAVWLRPVEAERTQRLRPVAPPPTVSSWFNGNVTEPEPEPALATPRRVSPRHSAEP